MAKPQQILHLLLGLLILIGADAAASSLYKKSKSQSMSEASPRGGSSAVFPLSGDVYPNG